MTFPGDAGRGHRGAGFAPAPDRQCPDVLAGPHVARLRGIRNG
ncbi:hypothetical protein ASZ90_002964 [hydrocarbon metagenome]|uniref:Uncharacterized protein n=1 Tax=hydrocarbon metagenome TaxID=938273 RepID=A0A0W8G2C8_9ZZZZ